MLVSIAIPNKSSFSEKEMLVKLASQSNLGIFVSDLPQNHDLFQLLSVWKTKFPDIPNIGTAIISPLIYEEKFLSKQIITLFELFESGMELGFGIGDRNLINKTIENRLETFEMAIMNLLANEKIKTSNNVISIAGSGKKIIDLVNQNDLGIIYNGIIDNESLSLIKSEISKKQISTYVMTDINEYGSLSKGFVTIVSRIITGLSKKELNRLQIDRNTVETIKIELSKQNLSSYLHWLPEEVIRKVAFFGKSEDIINQLQNLKSLNVKQTILSIIGTDKKREFITYLKKNEINL